MTNTDPISQYKSSGTPIKIEGILSIKKMENSNLSDDIKHLFTNISVSFIDAKNGAIKLFDKIKKYFKNSK